MGEEEVKVSEDILNVIQSGQVKTSSTSNKLSLLMDSSSDEEEVETLKKKSSTKKKKTVETSDNESGFLSDGYDADFYGDAEDRARLNSLTEVEREAILYERAQARQARQERRALEQRIREREEEAMGGSQQRRAPTKESDLKRKKLNELKAKRQRKLENKSDESEEEEEEEGEFEDESELESESEIEEERQISRKKKSSSKKHRKDSDEDYYTEDEVEDEKVVKKQKQGLGLPLEQDEKGDELDLDMANKLRLTRDILAQWIYRDGFEEIVQKSLLRINLGPGRTGQPTYRLVELKKIVQHHRTYLIKPGTPTNLAALVKFAKSERIFSFEFVSNSPFTQSEFAYWKMECERAGVKLPYNSTSARRKIEKFKAFHSEPLTDNLIQKMLERRKELTNAQNAPRNLLAEQTILQQQLKEALERGNNDEEINRIESELAAIAAKRQTAIEASKDRLAVMEDLNKRNRQANLETGRQAEISRMQAELPSAGNDKGGEKRTPTLDPFQRRKCKPTIIHMKEGNEEEEEENGAVDEPVAAVTKITTVDVDNSKKNEKNLFDAHDFDLDLDI